ncbi:MAG TPA: sugar ABC transporter permease, partial [Trueperaceae bacterium]|nr:sugar ABC transporter permease [Trueperaceae bacterium]
VFRTIFNPRETSLANQVLSGFGVTELPKWLLEKKPVLTLLFGNQIDSFNQWLSSTGAGWQFDGLWLGPSLALVVAAVFGIWTFTGYNVIIFLAGLGGISNNVYEAADIDGANNFEKFWHITIPLLAPVTFYLTILGFIGALQAFTHVFVMKTPAVGRAMDVASIHIFDTFYKSNNFSKAAAESILLFIVILLITIIQNRILGKKALNG